MHYSNNTGHKFSSLDNAIRNSDQIAKKANGGNSILYMYPPEKESIYIQAAVKHYVDDGVSYKEEGLVQAELIDISKLLVEYIDRDGWSDFSKYYKDMSPTSYQLFKSDDDPEEDLFDMIIKSIKRVSGKGKLPMLIRTGCLIGTGIENLNIMEHKDIMALKYPLILFYPSKIVNDTLYFLNYKPASKYRCILIQA